MEAERCIPGEAAELLDLNITLLDLLAAIYEEHGVRFEALEDRHEVVVRFDGREVRLEEAEALEKLALATRRVVDRMLRCPKCDYGVLQPKLQCPNCGSTDIEKVRIIQHVICGYIDLEINFRRGEGLVCPHCGVALASENDYRVLGTLYYCHNCHTRFHEPDVILVCRRCGARFKPTEAPYKPIYGLVLTEKGKRLLAQAHDLRVAVYHALRGLQRPFACNAKLAGSTGILYTVDFYLPDERLGIVVQPSIRSHNDAVYLTLVARDLAAAGRLQTLLVVSRHVSRESADILRSSPGLRLVEGGLPSRLVSLVEELVGGKRSKGG